MALIKKIQKIYRSFDFRGNRIINAKTDTPTDQSSDEILANKIYVDNTQIYTTTKAGTYQNPFKFSWITAVNGKTIKQIFDDLFFPNVLPIYKNLELSTLASVSFTNLKVSHSKLSHKYNAYIQQELVGIFNYILNSDADRTITNYPYIKIIDNTTQIETVFSGITTDLVSSINFDYQLLNLNITIKFGLSESSTTNTKQDAYGNDYIPTEFQSDYNYEIDITNLFLKDINIYNSFMISSIRSDEAIPTYLDSDVDSLFEYKNHLEIPNNTFGIYDILIPVEIVTEIKNDIPNKTLQYIIIDNTDINNPVTISIEELLFSWISKYTTGMQIEHGPVTYNKYQFNFGVWDFPVRIELTF